MNIDLKFKGHKDGTNLSFLGFAKIVHPKGTENELMGQMFDII